jgi:hypothetical protein
MTEATEIEPKGDVAPSERDDGSPFTRGFPDDPELNTLVAQGRYDVVRERAPKLAQATNDPEVARAALALRERLEADPLAVRLLLGALVLLVVLTSWAYLAHQH